MVPSRCCDGEQLPTAKITLYNGVLILILFPRYSITQIDVSNESHGIKVGMAASNHLTAGDNGPRQNGGCC
jgi:hypothetical protein